MLYINTYHNVTKSADRSYIPMDDGWRPGSEMKPSVEFHVLGRLTDEEALVYVSQHLVVGLPPSVTDRGTWLEQKRASDARTLAVGDMVTIRRQDGSLVAYGVAKVGWDLLYKIAG